MMADNTELDGVNRSAILMLALGPNEAAKIMKHLSPKQVQRLGVAMASLKNVGKEQVDTVIQDFSNAATNLTGLSIDSDEYIRNVMVQALGEERASSVIDRVLLGARAKGLDTLKWMDARSVSELIRYEHPQIQSIVLSYLEPDQAAEVMQMFDEVVRLDLMMRIASLDTVQPKALQELNDIMDKQFHGTSSVQSANIGGLKMAAEIMNFIDSGVEAQLIEQIKEKDQDMGQNIQDLMFVFDNLLDLDDRDIQAILREISSEALLLALKGADPLVKEKIFANMSKRAAELMRDDLEAKGPCRLSEVEAAQKEILATARRMADAGEISLGGKGGEEMV
jgi:flagellar motor switch protein FliG